MLVNMDPDVERTDDFYGSASLNRAVCILLHLLRALRAQLLSGLNIQAPKGVGSGRLIGEYTALRIDPHSAGQPDTDPLYKQESLLRNSNALASLQASPAPQSALLAEDCIDLQSLAADIQSDRWNMSNVRWTLDRMLSG